MSKEHRSPGAVEGGGTQLAAQQSSRGRPWWASRVVTLVLLGLQTACAAGYPMDGTLAGTSRSWRRGDGPEVAAATWSDARGEDLEVTNLRRAARLPWTDGGRCVVEEASQPWPELVERCFHALDQERVRFKDTTGRCAVASTGAAVMGIGVCVLAAPEIVVGTVIVAGVVVVGFVIKEALDAYALDMGRPEVRPAPETRPVPETAPAPQKPSPKKRPKPEPKGPDFPPPEPPETSERDRHRCEPVPVPYHLGGNKLHDKCADRIPNNSFPGGDVFVNGKNFDALQLATRTLWEVKTDNFDTFPPDLREIVVENQVEELRHERALALACGFTFRVGVRSPAHKEALEFAEPQLEGLIIVMDWC